MHESPVVEAAEKIYRALSEQDLDVLLDDRDVRGGIKFKDADLLGTPLRITIGMRTLEKGRFELKGRTDSESTLIPVEDAAAVIRGKITELYDSIK